VDLGKNRVGGNRGDVTQIKKRVEPGWVEWSASLLAVVSASLAAFGSS
jgi:hypothetical protein